MSNNVKVGVDEISGVTYELIPEKPIDQFFAILSVLYLLLAMAFFLWQLFDVWVGQYTLARLVPNPNLQLLDNPAFHLAIYAFIGGALGGVTYGFRSFWLWHAERYAFGHRFFWVYLIAPWVGAVLGLFTYALTQGGIAIFSGNTTSPVSNPSQVLATFGVSVLAGYGSQQVFIWLDAQVSRIFQVSPKQSTADRVVVPVLIDLTQIDAEAALQKVGLDLGVIELKDQTDPAKIGKVIDQKPARGTKVDSGSTVNVAIGQAPKPASSVSDPVV
jgi:hypothetical protein